MTDFSKGSDMFEMFGAYYNFVRDNWEFQDTDEYWDDLQVKCTKFNKSYNDDPFALELILAFLRLQDRRCFHADRS